MTKLSYACLATGSLYDRDVQYIDGLYRMLAAHSPEPFELLCFTDRPRRVNSAITQVDCSAWVELERQGMRPTTRKLGLFNPDYTKRDWIIYFDLTLVIRKSIAPMVDFMQKNKDKLNIIQDWNHPSYNSSVMAFSPEQYRFIYDAFVDGVTYTQKVKGDQEFIYHHLLAQNITDTSILPEHYVCSFKRAVRTAWKNPDEARQMIESALIVKFHGAPRMHEAFDPLYRLRKFTLKAIRYGKTGLPFSIRELERAWINP